MSFPLKVPHFTGIEKHGYDKGVSKLYVYPRDTLLSFQTSFRSGGSVVANRLDYQCGDRKIDPQLLFSGLWDETFNRGPVPRITSLLVGR